MAEASVIDSVSAKPVHMFKGSFRDDGRGKRTFGEPGPIGDDFVERLLERGVDYDPKLAYVLSVIAGWSYSDGAVLARQLKYYGLAGASVEEIAIRNPAMYIIATAFFVRSPCGRLGILSFRGTEPTNIISWLTDADVNPRNFSGTGFVHRGFYANLRALWEDLGEALERAVAKQYGNGSGNGGAERAPLEKLFITGHSLGAAMAVLAAAKIVKDGAAPLTDALQGVYTYGQPAVGDAEFARHYGQKFGKWLFRHDYHFDAVPRLPPASTGQYVHFGELRVASDTSKGWQSRATLSAQSPFLAWTAISILASFVGRRIPALTWLDAKLFRYSVFDDHSPTRYIDTSRAALSNI
jgi:hypothetical protein